MTTKKKVGDKLKLKVYADIALSPAWEKVIKPDLIKLKERYSNSEVAKETIDEAAINDIKRVQTIKIINTIIRSFERANKKL